MIRTDHQHRSALKMSSTSSARLTKTSSLIGARAGRLGGEPGRSAQDLRGGGEGVLYAVKAVKGLLGLAGRKEIITEQNVRYIINLVKAGNEEHINDIAWMCSASPPRAPIKPKTLGQKRYVDAIKKNTITLGIGPAGTGKTYLAVAAAVAPSGTSRSTASSSPARRWEAGEQLGFLPGDLQSKVDPYLRPVRRPLRHAGAETYNKYLERAKIEVALAYMWGATSGRHLPLDEAQNTSREQMKMFLTRLGFGFKDRSSMGTHPDRPAPGHGVRAKEPCGCWTAWRTSPIAVAQQGRRGAPRSSSASSRPMREDEKRKGKR